MKITRRKHQLRAVWLKAGVCLFVAILITAGVYLYSTQQLKAPQHQQTTSQPSKESTQQFAELSEQPARLTIEDIGVDAAIIPVGLTKDGEMDAPNNVKDIGWYNQSAKAGEGKYSILLDGHHGVNERAVFERLKEVSVGGIIKLFTKNNTELSYIIRETETTPYQQVDMKRALMPYKAGLQSLTIITCEGTYSNTEKTYDNRTIVYAERVK